jgi:hypothetical protein
MEEEEKILENITKNISSRLKVPIILTYLCVLFLYNWDILYYLFFENESALTKIIFIQANYSCVYFKRILICLSISTALIVIFTILNTLLNFCLKWFYRKDKEMTSEIENYEKISVLSEQLSESVDQIKQLKTEIDIQKNINQSLSSKSLDVNVNEISKKDFNQLVSHLRNQPNSEKLLFSLKELISILNKNNDIEVENVRSSVTYREDMEILLTYLSKQNLLKTKRDVWDKQKSNYVNKLEMSKSFKDFLKMEI